MASKDNKLSIEAICLMILSAFAVTVALMHLQSVMVPFVLSLFMYFMISPFVNLFQVWFRIPRVASVGLTLFLATLGIVLVVLAISSSVSGFLKGAQDYNERIVLAADQVQLWATAKGFPIELSYIKENLQAGKVFGFAKGLTSEFMGVLGTFFLIVVFLIFLLLGQAKAGPRSKFFQQVHNKVTQYTWTKFITSLSTGMLVWLILSVIGLDLAFMFGVLAFLLNFIPSIGSIVATLLPIPVALLQFGVGVPLILTILLPGAVQISVGNIIEPKLMGQSLGLHPVTLLFFLVFWGIVWGIPGMFLAVPITAILKYVLETFKPTAKLANLMAGEF